MMAARMRGATNPGWKRWLGGGDGQATATLAELRAKLVEYDRTTEALVGAKGRLAAASRRLKALEWDHEVRGSSGVLHPAPRPRTGAAANLQP